MKFKRNELLGHSVIVIDEFSVQIFLCKLVQYYPWFTFFVCFKLKSYINIKITKAKGKICF